MFCTSEQNWLILRSSPSAVLESVFKNDSSLKITTLVARFKKTLFSKVSSCFTKRQDRSCICTDGEIETSGRLPPSTAWGFLGLQTIFTKDPPRSEASITQVSLFSGVGAEGAPALILGLSKGNDAKGRPTALLHNALLHARQLSMAEVSQLL